MQAAHDNVRFVGTDSHLASILQLLCVWGELSWSVGQQIARAAELDAEEFMFGLHPAVKSFARLGTSGIYVGNVRRDGMRTFKPIEGLSRPLMVRLPFQTTKTKTVVSEADFPLILPSVLFEDLFRNFHRKFVSMFGQGVRKFWDSLKHDDPRLVGNPMLAVENWKDLYVPLVLHSDGVAFTQKGNSLMCGSMSFLLAQHWDTATIFLLSIFAKVNRVYRSVIGTPDTFEIIWKYKLHYLIGLFSGVHPAKDPYGNFWPEGSGAAKYAGQKICGGHFRSCVHLLAHDRDYGANELGQEHWNAARCCLWCLADRGRFNVREVGPNARWKQLLYTPGPHDRKVSTHDIWNIPGVTRFSHPGDLMHAGDGGVLGHLHGSACK